VVVECRGTRLFVQRVEVGRDGFRRAQRRQQRVADGVQWAAQLPAQTDIELFSEVFLEKTSRVYGRDLLKVRWPAGIRG
jgi:hypothetical protein